LLKGYKVMRGGRLALGLNRKCNYKSINIPIKEKWICDWDKNKKGRHYLQFQPKITQKTIKTHTDRRT
jgi:hypothetical protein